jgi:type II secretory pathway predicted ATPase ExeA
MYHPHFGLERGLFGEGIAADTAVFRTPKHDRLIAHFKLALASPSSVAVLRGPAGVGKTTLTSAALRMTSTRLALAWLDGTATNTAELLELILVELGVDTLRTTRIERVQLWRQFRSEMRATDSRLFLVVERAEDLTAEVLHALDQLTAPDAAGNPGANLVLLGNDGLDAHLAAPILDSLRQRVRLRAELEPFSEAELQDYLRHQTACAGGTFDRVFAPGSVAALFRYSRGVARLANTLCESALDVAAVQQQKQLTAELIAKTAVSLLGLAEAAPASRPAEPAANDATHVAPAVNLAPNVAPAVNVAPNVAPAVNVPPAANVASAAVISAPADARPAPQPAAPPLARPPEPPAAVAPEPLPFVEPPLAKPAEITPVIAALRPAVPPAPVVPVRAAAVPPQRVEVEFDGGATDVTDVALADFPILTDAVEFPAAFAAAKPPGPAVAKTPPVTSWPAAAPSLPPPAAAVPAAPVAVNAAPKPAGRLETAYTGARPAKAAPAFASPLPAAPALPTVTPLPHAKPAIATPASPDEEDDDLLHQTQTMRAIAVAKSIDDISSSMAETLFGDAELDLVSAALASAAADWPEDNDANEPAAPAVVAKAAKAAPPPDDPFDLFDLGDDAPLELIDDSVDASSRKTATR